MFAGSIIMKPRKRISKCSSRVDFWMMQSETVAEEERLWLNRKEWLIQLCGFVHCQKAYISILLVRVDC